jgi:uncharacterized protein YdaU (DUF1376 family)
MHYYKFNIADYRKDTSHLTTIEHGIYRQLIDWYYLDEKPIPLETQVVYRRLRLGSDMEFSSLQNVLSDFFKEGKTGYVHKRIEVEIKDYHEQVEKNKNNGKLGGRPKKTQSVIDGLSNESQNNPNHKPLTTNHNSVSKDTGDKPPLSIDEIIFGYGVPFLINAGTPEKSARSFLGSLRKVHGDETVVNTLRDCMKAKPLQPLEWLAKALPPNEIKKNPGDIIHMTVPASNLPDPALEKIKADALKAAPMPESFRQFAKQVRKA